MPDIERIPDKDHYTAVIEISHTRVKVEGPGRGMPGSETRKKSVEDVARIVVRADSIEALITKATAHLNLVED